VRIDVQKHGPGGIIAKDVGPRVASGGEMVQSARKFKTKRASHHGSVRKDDIDPSPLFTIEAMAFQREC